VVDVAQVVHDHIVSTYAENSRSAHVAGDSIAGEAAAGSLRHVLTRPVGRTRLLFAKLVAILVFAFSPSPR
jgi:hypothetical protein